MFQSTIAREYKSTTVTYTSQCWTVLIVNTETLTEAIGKTKTEYDSNKSTVAVSKNGKYIMNRAS